MNTNNQHPMELLPWYVNGSLSDAEKNQIEAHIGTCDVCQHEIKLLEMIREQTKQSAQSPGELNKLRFMREIKQDTQQNTRTQRPWWQTITAVAAALVIVIQAGVILNQKPTKDTGMQLLGKSTAEYSVEFNQTASLGQINQFLKSVGGHIVNGPIETSDGKIFYELDLEAIHENSSTKDRQDWEAKLKAHADVIKGVNPIDAN